ncbi:MAG: hypothetical protein H6707_15985 [Deltaproteobacteria bacterium]|nr:hypothetical protein [Deltaproteobacteria bacterium]
MICRTVYLIGAMLLLSLGACGDRGLTTPELEASEHTSLCQLGRTDRQTICDWATSVTAKNQGIAECQAGETIEIGGLSGPCVAQLSAATTSGAALCQYTVKDLTGCVTYTDSKLATAIPDGDGKTKAPKADGGSNVIDSPTGWDCESATLDRPPGPFKLPLCLGYFRCPGPGDRRFECSQPDGNRYLCTCTNERTGEVEGSFESPDICQVADHNLIYRLNQGCGWQLPGDK